MRINDNNVCEFCFEPLSDGGICKKCGISSDTYKTDTQALVPGTVISEKYVIGALLEKGNDFFSYLAYSREYGKKVIVREYFSPLSVRASDGKTVSPISDSEQDNYSKEMEAFADEAKKIAGFNVSKNVRTVYELLYENGTVYYSAEECNGYTLFDFVNSRGGCLGEYEILTVAKHICNALMVVHSTGMLYRGITPYGIFITNSGVVKLTDFDMTSAANAKSVSQYSSLGAYAPAEFGINDMECGAYSDIYSLGALMYYCAFGKDIPNAELRNAGTEINYDSSTNKVSDEFKAITEKCLKTDSSERYQTVILLSNEIAALLENHVKNGNIPTFNDTDGMKIVLEPAVSLTVAGTAAGGAAVSGEIDEQPKQLTSRDYSNRSTARNAEREKAKNKPENTPPKKVSENMIVPAAQDDVVINVGDRAGESDPEIAVGDARQAVPPVKKKKSPVGIIVAIVLILAVISAGAVLYFTGMLDDILGTGNQGWTNSTGGVCVHCGSGDHLTIDHPPCKFCKVKTHFSEDHPRCEYCGMQEHYTEEHPPCDICGRMDHFTEKHPPCKHCGSLKHFTESHKPCGICGLYSHFTNKHPCDYCTTGGHNSSDCPHKPNPCAVCNSNDHITADHPYYCINCGYTDHDTKDCPSLNPYCNSCNNYGHTAEQCPNTADILS